MLRKGKHWYRPCVRCGESFIASSGVAGRKKELLASGKGTKGRKRKLCNKCRKIIYNETKQKRIEGWMNSNRYNISTLTKPEYVLSQDEYQEKYGDSIHKAYVEQMNRLRNKINKRRTKYYKTHNKYMRERYQKYKSDIIKKFRLRYLENREKEIDRAERYYLKNKEKMDLYRRDYRSKVNRDKLNEIARLKYKANIIEERNRKNIYNKTNRDKVNALARDRYRLNKEKLIIEKQLQQPITSKTKLPTEADKTTDSVTIGRFI
jgi:hypothetical protein